MSYSSEVLADSPLVYWRLGEASGTTMVDSSGNGRDGTYTAGTGTVVLGVPGLIAGDSDTAIQTTGQGRGAVADAAWMDPPVSPVTVAVATASSAFGGEGAGNAFNGSAIPWTTNGPTTGWVRAELGSATALQNYAITRRDDIPTRNPTAWTFEGSNDGSTWTTLDTQTGLTWPTAGEVKAFTFVNATSYLYYRLNVTANNGAASYLSVAELWLGIWGGYTYEAVIDVLSTSGTSRTIASRYSGVTSVAGWSLRLDGATLNAFIFPLASGHPTATLTTGKHHIALAHDPYSTAKLYVDGALISTTAKWQPAGIQPLVIGNNAAFGEPAGSNLVIDEVAIYGTELSSVRIAAHHAALTPTPGASGALAATLPTLTTALTGSYSPPPRDGDLAVVLPGVDVDMVGTYLASTASGTLAATLPGVGVDLAGAYTPPPVAGDLAATLPTANVAMSGSYAAPIGAGHTGVLAVVLPGVEVQMNGTTDWAATDPGGEDDGWDLIGHVDYDPPATAPPTEVATAIAAGEAWAQAFGPVTMNGTEPVHTTAYAYGPSYRVRVVVDGQDVTYFRDIPLPPIPYQLVEPFLYNTATMTVPQVLAWAEQLSVGDRSWMRKDAPVRIQLYDDATDTVVATLWKGWVKSLDPSGDTPTLQLDGEILGRATDDFKPQSLFRTKADIGVLMMRAVRHLGGRTASRLGPTTKIEQYRVGGSTMIHHLLETIGIAQDKRGRQWTVMPDDQGRYDMFRKNTTDIDFTIYLTGDSGAYPYSLRSDLGEEVTDVYATGLTPEGERILFGLYPGFQQMDPPPFPGTMSEGDTNETTSTGAGVTVLIRRLANFSYLTLDELPGGFDDDVSDAVKRLQRQAKLDPTGVVNAATWRALFDLDTTGRTLRNSRVGPAASVGYTEEYRFSSTGAIIGFNPDYDAGRRRVARFYDFGAGHRRGIIQDFAEAELDDGSKNWAGSITVRSGAVIAGQHNVGDPLTDADFMHAGLIRPGMNCWLPQFDGGTKVRVGIVDASGDGREYTLRVDSRNRDATKLSAVIARIRAMRDDPARSFWKDFKSGRQTEALTEFSEVGGYLDDGLDLDRGWTIVPFIAGDSGMIQSIEFDTFPARESVVAITGEEVVADVFERNIGDPSTQEGTERWANENVVQRLRDNHGLLYQAGGFDDMGGYYPGQMTGNSSIITGEFGDHASFPYYTRRLPLLYMAIWVSGPTRIRSGRILKANMQPV